MPESRSLLSTIVDSIPPVHRDGHKFLAIGLGITLLFFWLLPPLGWIAALATAWVAYFFRDPDRVTPLREGLVIAPADGRITSIERVRPPQELGLSEELRTRISIFLSVFDVHVNRSPVAGRITRSVYTPGAFFNAELDKASEENERRGLVILMPSARKSVSFRSPALLHGELSPSSVKVILSESASGSASSGSALAWMFISRPRGGPSLPLARGPLLGRPSWQISGRASRSARRAAARVARKQNRDPKGGFAERED